MRDIKKIKWPRTPDIRLWTLAGCFIQGLVFLGDLATPLGFAHGILYAPPIALGLIARSASSIWLIATLGMLGTVLGFWGSTGILVGVESEYILLNRLLGLVTVFVSGVAASVVLRMGRHRRMSQAALEETTALLEVSSAVGGLGGWRVKLPDLESFWSKEVFKLFDRPVGPIPDVEAIINWYAPEHQALVREKFEDCVRRGRPFDVEVQVVYRDGSRRWVRVVGEAVFAGAGQVVGAQGAIQDIEKHKRVEAEIESSRAEWRLLAESVPMIVWVTDASGVMTYVNPFTADYMGADVEKLLGDGWLSHVHEDDRVIVQSKWAESVTTQEPYLAEFRVRRHDGQWRWHVARAVRVTLPTGGQWYGTAMDVQDFREAQEARTDLATRLSDTMESVTDAIFVLDQQWVFTFMNRQSEVVLERRREDLLGKCVWDEFPEARGSKFHQEYERCARTGETVRFDAEYAPLHKHFEVNAYPYNGGVVVYFRDATEQRRLAEKLQQSQRMDSLGKLTGGVAHDFNNLLTVILGNAEILAEQPRFNADERVMIDMIAAAAKRGAEMTQRLLAFARKQALAPAVIELNDLVKEVSPLLHRSLGEHIEIKVVHAGGLWKTLVDPGPLEMALLNLAVNARDAMPDGGRLTIETANAYLDDDCVSRHLDLQAGHYVMLAVSDTGHGIAPDLLNRVFEPFFTTKDVGKGTGLGLAMVYGFVKQSRGHIAIYSEVNRGTTVKIYLPRAVGAGDRPDSKLAEDKEHDGQGRLVLLVEDDKLVRKIGRRQLESLGYRVLEAENGEQALHHLVSEREIAVLFTDVVMPGGMSGGQLAAKARELRPLLPVLFTSGYTENAIVHHGRLDPGVLLLGKPYLRSQLAEKLSQALSLVP